ncbi:SIR2 family NAD-dependent protein deacylase [Hartmannibacter diazotrophicus]|nr:SIR2 family protein [Hartmannibacter diazotrophicus]
MLEKTVVSGTEAVAVLADVRRALLADQLVPYLGPLLLAIESEPPVPTAPEEVAAALHAKAPAPGRIRTNMWSVAQFIESRRHRKTLQAFMAEIFARPVQPTRLHRFLAGLKLGMMIDSWYDGALASALRDAGRTDFVEIQGVTRAGEFRDIWTKVYGPDGREVLPETAENATTVLYAPHGGVNPVGNFLVADSDYVEVLTEIDIQSPIPAVVKDRRSARGFLFVGCRFHDQMLRTYARQIMKRSSGPHYALIDAETLTKNERKFLEQQGIQAIDLPLGQAVEALID